MKYRNMLIMVMVVLAVFFCMNCVEVRAEDTGDLSYEEGAEEYIPTDEEVALEQKKMQELYMTPSLATEGFKTLAVTCYRQENEYYCGPATVKQVVHYLTKIEKTQDYFAGLLKTTEDGTDFSVIPAVLNSEIGENHYVYSSIQTQDMWYARIRLSTDNNYPVVLDIKTKDISDFPYEVTGHIVNTSGYNEIQSPTTVRITDPYWKGIGNKWYNITNLYNANAAHFRKAMIW